MSAEMTVWLVIGLAAGATFATWWRPIVWCVRELWLSPIAIILAALGAAIGAWTELTDGAVAGGLVGYAIGIALMAVLLSGVTVD